LRKLAAFFAAGGVENTETPRWSPFVRGTKRARPSVWPRSFYICGTEKERESKFPAAQIGIWEGGTKICPRAAFTWLVFEIKGQPFYGWFVDESNDKTQARF
jgi:hypothetical protein